MSKAAGVTPGTTRSLSMERVDQPETEPTRMPRTSSCPDFKLDGDFDGYVKRAQSPFRTPEGIRAENLRAAKARADEGSSPQAPPPVTLTRKRFNTVRGPSFVSGPWPLSETGQSIANAVKAASIAPDEATPGTKHLPKDEDGRRLAWGDTAAKTSSA